MQKKSKRTAVFKTDAKKVDGDLFCVFPDGCQTSQQIKEGKESREKQKQAKRLSEKMSVCKIEFSYS